MRVIGRVELRIDGGSSAEQVVEIEAEALEVLNELGFTPAVG